MERQVELHKPRCVRLPIIWMGEYVQLLKIFGNKWFRAIDFLCSSVIKGFFVEFVIEADHSFTVVESMLFLGPRGRYMNLLNL